MYKKWIKRIIDIIVSMIVLIILIPVYAVILILIKAIDRGPIIYKQNRTGRYGKNFKIYKFRTMKDGKITKLGRILRENSLDELPQFYNVLKGDMSIVGPRPWIPEYFENFNDIQKKRVNVKPGIIGLAQVNGRKHINIFDKIEYDIEYVESVSFFMDLKILLQSVKVVMTKEECKNPNEYIYKEIEQLKKQNINRKNKNTDGI